MSEERVTRQLAEARACVNRGEFGRARERLRRLETRRLRRQDRLAAASLARLVGLPGTTLRMLRREVEPSRQGIATASPQELAQYAAALVDVRALVEALSLLREIDPVRAPQALLFEAWIHFFGWNWEKAVPLLERYLDMGSLTPSLRLGGQVNLASALIHGPRDLERARELLAEAMERSQDAGLRFHRKGALIARAQLEFFERDWAGARSTLQLARETCLEPEDVYYGLRLRQWGLYVDLYSSRDPARVLPRLESFKQEAAFLGYEEMPRSADFHLASLTRNRDLLTHLYFGTPYPGLRRRVAELLGGEAGLPERYPWRLGSSSRRSTAEVDAANGTHGRGGAFLKEGQLPQRLLSALSCDFYRTFRVAELHELVHPGLRYDPDHAPDRIHQSIRRLRGWLRMSRLPLEIRERETRYRLASDAACAVWVRRDPFAPAALTVRHSREMERLRDRFGAGAFSAAEAAGALGISHRSANLLLKEALGQERLRRSGAGPSTRYRLA